MLAVSTGGGLVADAVLLVAQIAVILIAAKLGAEICERYLKQPAVLGELVAGILLSPFVFGHFLSFPGHGPLFPLPADAHTIPISPPLFGLSQIAVVLLLFIAGLETNLKQFLRYAGPATVIAMAGLILPFVVGAWLAVLFGAAEHWSDTSALFVGSIMTATSVGITARVLGDMRRLDSPEGVTVLAGAVVDDVLGILVLSVVVAMAAAEASGTKLELAKIGTIALGAVGFWLGLTVLGIAFARPVEKILLWFRSRGSVLPLALALCFLASAAAESFGLAMIIGSYVFGLALSTRPLAGELIESLEPVAHFLVPIFFVVTGMMVNLEAMQGVLLFGVVLSIVAVLTKWLGCGGFALFFGFNLAGANRIGVGMVPRGEVALIIAQVGIAKGIIDQSVYGVSIMMTLITTLVAPTWLQFSFRRGGVGVKTLETSEGDTTS